MKKKLFACLLLCLIICANIGVCAFADGGNYVADAAGLLGAGEIAQLEQKCAEVSDRYGCGVYIVTVPDFRDYGSSPWKANEAIFKANNLGIGEDKNGVVLMLSMDDRDYDILAHGDIGNYAFTDYGKDLLADSFLDDFRESDWLGGFEDFVGACDYYLEAAQDGNPIDVPQREEHKMTLGEKIPIFAAISSAISALFCGVSRGSMKNAKRKYDAGNYVSSGLKLYIRQDRFTHRTQTVQRIQKSSSSGGKGGTTVNSGGFSHKSGKF